MKIIDLLNKIANKEEIHYELFYKGEKYYLLSKTTDYMTLKNIYLFKDLFSNEDPQEFLNDEVEVLDEDKMIEKLKWNEKSSYNQETDSKKVQKILLSRSEQLKSTLNELVEEVNKLRR